MNTNANNINRARVEKRLPYAKITRAAGKHADDVMCRMPRGRLPFLKQRQHWAVAFEAFKRGARWAIRRK